MTPKNRTNNRGTMRFCPVCSNYLFLKEDDSAHLQLLCRHCGFQQRMAPTSAADALVLETTFNVATNEKQTVSQLNEYTKLDRTLPRLKTIACPNPACPSQSDTNLRDIMYMKTDAKKLKFQYSCKVCNTHWGS